MTYKEFAWISLGFSDFTTVPIIFYNKAISRECIAFYQWELFYYSFLLLDFLTLRFIHRKNYSDIFVIWIWENRTRLFFYLLLVHTKFPLDFMFSFLLRTKWFSYKLMSITVIFLWSNLKLYRQVATEKHFLIYSFILSTKHLLNSSFHLNLSFIETHILTQSIRDENSVHGHIDRWQLLLKAHSRCFLTKN